MNCSLHRKTQINRRSDGFSLPELMVSSVILAGVVAASAQLSSSTADGMRRSSLRAKTDSAMARRMEEIRHCAFFYLIDNSLINNSNQSDCRLLQLNIAEQLKYPDSSNIDTFKSHCDNNTLSTGLKAYLSSNQKNLTTSFNLNDYDQTAKSVPITTEITSSGNLLQVTLAADSIPARIQSTIVPHAQGWCR